jgi:selenocysteine lyase/cysteine desulfurase
MESSSQLTKFGHAMNQHFLFDPQFKNLNHGMSVSSSPLAAAYALNDPVTNVSCQGSFGTYPAPVQTVLRKYQSLAEAAPDKFMRYTYSPLLDAARASIAEQLKVPVDECVFIQNASSGVGTVLRNLVYERGDVIVYFDTIYAACEKLIASLIETTPNLVARKVQYELPCSHDVIVNNFLQLVKQVRSEGLKPRVAVFDTIVSMPGVRFPFERLTAECKKAGILSCIDGAHGVGHIPLNLRTLDADFFVSNCHKWVSNTSLLSSTLLTCSRWLYTPRGCAVFHVPQRNQHLIRTTYPTSHGFQPVVNIDPSAPIRNPLPPDGKSAFVSLFQFVATTDNAPYYCVPEALHFRRVVCGGEEKIYTYIRDIAQHGAERIAAVLGTDIMDDGAEWENGGGGLRDCAMANIRLPLSIDGVDQEEVDQARNWMEMQLADKYQTFACIYEYKGRLWARVSGQVYLELDDFEWLGGVLKRLCMAVKTGGHLQQLRSRL